MMRTMPVAIHLVVTLLIAATTPALSIAAQQVEINAGKHDRVDTPVRIVLPGKIDAKHYRVGDVVVAVAREDATNYLTVILNAKAGEVVKLNIEPIDNGAVESLMQCAVDDKHIDLVEGDRRILRYNRAIVSPPKGAKPSHARSGYIHPVLTPTGRVVTNAYAERHWHHYGLWFPWRKTKFEGNAVNFWETGGGQGTVRHSELISHGHDRFSAWFDVAHDHVALKIKGAPKTVLNETWHVHAYATKSHHLFDVNSTQTTATKSPLTIEKYYYGGFGMRGSGHWEGDAVEFLTSEGKTRKDGNFTAARWVSMSGQLDGKPAGITIMGHPKNFRAPQKTRLHPKEPFFCFAPGMDAPFSIKPGESYVSRYRFLVHDGKVDTKLMDRLWNDYAEPPTVVIQK